jgi:peptide/nickel transport system substrate-binding protein
MDLKYQMTPTNIVSKNIFLVIQINAKKAGINIESNVLEANLYLDAVKKRTYELFSGGFSLDGDLYDPYQLWHTSSDTPNGFNRTGFGNAGSDALIEELRKTLDKPERDKMYMEFQRMVYDEVPMIFLFSQKQRIAIHKKFQNVKLGSIDPGFNENYFH